MDTEGHSLPSASCGDGRKRRVCYYYDPGIANVDYGADHNMVPRRVAMAHALVEKYGLLADMERLRVRPATEAELRAFHDDAYVRLLRDITPDAYHDGDLRDRARACRVGVPDPNEPEAGGAGAYIYDNPVIDGLWDYCLRYAGGSLAAARALVDGSSDIAINWSGGMHHACRGKASGFCYVNDIVLAIQELLKHFERVLYVDIDVHHGDGVEAHFKRESRVMTVSFHLYDIDRRGDKFFPGTGKAEDVGEGDGKYYTLNVPMKAGMDDERYQQLFRPIMDEVMEKFAPDAVVLQCGADSLYGDRLGEFRLSVKGHAGCVSYLRSFNVPLLLLGGGGYTVNHVASCWCYETAVAVGKEKEISDEIPFHGYEHYYKDQGYKLHFTVPKKNGNKKDDLIDKIKQDALMNLAMLKPPPTTVGEHRPSKRHAINVKAHYDQNQDKKAKKYRCRREDDDPMERLHRLCGEADRYNFFTELGKRKMSGLVNTTPSDSK
ncbi:histone deacetylase 19-like [Aegilops tauschii subsp. strangulata]|uniref:Histone deacetylase n=3 Tax=Aegilops tauschii TaxID=37682 RepID=A0A453LA09_AEGTS|nr:histone deacetylase 19-like [Aegilops tauschii subsp. strangulata]